MIASKILKTAAVIILVLGFLGLGLAQESGKEGKSQAQEKQIIKSLTKEVSGEVSGLSSNFIAIVYERDKKKGVEYEISLPIEKDIRLVYKQRLDQIKVGDIVRIQYEEVTEEYKEGPKQSRKAKIISFVKPAEKKPEAAEFVDEEEALPN